MGDLSGSQQRGGPSAGDPAGRHLRPRQATNLGGGGGQAHGLGPRVRQMLILMDGKRDTAALLAMFPPEVGPTLLTQLVEGGFARALVPGELSPPPGTIQPAGALTGHTAPAPLTRASPVSVK